MTARTASDGATHHVKKCRFCRSKARTASAGAPTAPIAAPERPPSTRSENAARALAPPRVPRSLLIDPYAGLPQVLERFGLRLPHRGGRVLLAGRDALDRLVDLLADLRIDRHRAVLHVARASAELEHLQVERRDILAVEGQRLLERLAVDDRAAADAGIAVLAHDAREHLLAQRPADELPRRFLLARPGRDAEPVAVAAGEVPPRTGGQPRAAR